jgi:hypothetical protein
MLLPSYVVDVWVSGSDESGNPFDTFQNSVNEPFASWPLALLGPSFDLDADTTSLKWDEPSPTTGQQVNMVVHAKNNGGKGDVTFVLQRLVVGGNWAEISSLELEVGAGTEVQASLGTIADVTAGEQIEFRVLVLVDGVEMDRRTVDPLIIKHQTSRDGDALKEQASEGQFTIALFVIAMLSIGFGVYTMVMSRRILKGKEVDESDQTAEVIADLDVKELPSIESFPATLHSSEQLSSFEEYKVTPLESSPSFDGVNDLFETSAHQPTHQPPSSELMGMIDLTGQEVIEYPAASGVKWIRTDATQPWTQQ